MQLQHRKLMCEQATLVISAACSWLAADLTCNSSILLAFSAGRPFYRELPEERPPWWKPMHPSLKTTFSEAPPFTFPCKWTQDPPLLGVTWLFYWSAIWCCGNLSWSFFKFYYLKKKKNHFQHWRTHFNSFFAKAIFPCACSMQMHFLGWVLPRW